MTTPDGTTSEPAATGETSTSEGSPARPPTVRSAAPPDDFPPFPPPLQPGAYGWRVPPGFPPPPGYPPPPGFPPPYPGGPYVRAYYPPPPPPVAPGGAPLAEAWERLVAYIVDYAILSAVGLVPLAIVAAVLWSRLTDAFHRISVENQEAADGASIDPFIGVRHLFVIELTGFAILLPVALLISYLYMVTMMHRTGQTIGKRIMKIQVVRASDGGPITMAMARKRWLVEQPAALFAPYFSYADSLWLLWDKPYRQCLHDKCAETVVVKSNRE